MPVFATPGPIRVSLDLAVGDVHVIASDRTDTVVEVRPRHPEKAADKRAAEQAQVEFADGRLQVHLPRSWRLYTPLGGKEAVDVEIQVPTGSELVSDLLIGRLLTQGILGTCEVKSGAGAVVLEETGSLRVKCGSGATSVQHISGDAEVESGAGSVRIGRALGAVTVKNSYGNTTIGTVDGPLRIKCAYGETAVDRAGSSVTVSSAYGDISIEELVTGIADIKGGYGQIELGIREGTAVWLDAVSPHGSVRTTLESQPGAGEADQTLELHARTSWGDIVVRRARAAEHA